MLGGEFGGGFGFGGFLFHEAAAGGNDMLGDTVVAVEETKFLFDFDKGFFGKAAFFVREEFFTDIFAFGP